MRKRLEIITLENDYSPRRAGTLKSSITKQTRGDSEKRYPSQAMYSLRNITTSWTHERVFHEIELETDIYTPDFKTRTRDRIKLSTTEGGPANKAQAVDHNPSQGSSRYNQGQAFYISFGSRGSSIATSDASQRSSILEATRKWIGSLCDHLEYDVPELSGLSGSAPLKDCFIGKGETAMREFSTTCASSDILLWKQNVTWWTYTSSDTRLTLSVPFEMLDEAGIFKLKLLSLDCSLGT